MSCQITQWLRLIATQFRSVARATCWPAFHETLHNQRRMNNQPLCNIRRLCSWFNVWNWCNIQTAACYESDYVDISHMLMHSYVYAGCTAYQNRWFMSKTISPRSKWNYVSYFRQFIIIQSKCTPCNHTKRYPIWLPDWKSSSLKWTSRMCIYRCNQYGGKCLANTQFLIICSKI